MFQFSQLLQSIIPILQLLLEIKRLIDILSEMITQQHLVDEIEKCRSVVSDSFISNSPVSTSD